MADDQHELRSINWGEVFSFTHIFKSWRMAIQPSKLLLALGVVIAICAAGWVMDCIWSSAGRTVRTGEIGAYVMTNAEQFDLQQEQAQRERPDRVAALAVEARSQQRSLSQFSSRLGGTYLAPAFRDLLAKANAALPPAPVNGFEQFRQKAQEDWAKTLGEARGSFKDETKRIEKLLGDAHGQAEDQIEKLPGDQRDDALKQLRKERGDARRALATRKAEFHREVKAIRGQGIFEGLLAFEANCVRGSINAVLRGDILSGLREHISRQRSSAVVPATEQPVPAPAVAAEQPGVLYFVAVAMGGVCWLVTQHIVYALVFVAVSLLAWALLGGAMYRIAALHATREEKISALAALRFSAGKFFSFYTAPLGPLAIIMVLGLLLAVGGLLGNIPGGVGALLVGAFFLLAILVGLLIAFLTIGLTGGVSLMYPTIAVEGSDGFDAISRSFSYVFSRPWRALLYAFVALVYGTLCYLFVRLFAFLALLAAHTFAGWFIWTGGEQLSPQADTLDVLWATPTFEQFHGAVNWSMLGGLEAVGAALLSLWVHLVIATVAAFLISFFASASTMIYLLLRRHVDTTDLNDVWVEESAEEPAPGQPEMITPPPPAAPQPPAAPPPSSPPPQAPPRA